MEKKEEKRKKVMEEGRKEGGKTLIADLLDQGVNLELALGIPHNEPQEFSPGSRSPKYQVHPSGCSR